MLKKQSYWLGLSYIFFILLSFGALKFNLSSFGIHDFGLWLMLSSIWGFGTSLDLGIGFSMIKFISEYKDSDEQKLKGLLSSSLFLMFVLSIVIYVFLYYLGNYYYLENKNIWQNDLELTKFKTIFIFLSVIFLIRYYTSFFKGICEGFNRYNLTSKMEMVRNLAIFLIAGVTWWLNKGMVFLVLLNLLTGLVIVVIYISIILYSYKKYFKLAYIKNDDLKNLFKFSISIQFMNVFASLVDPAVKFVVGNYYNVETVSLYEIAKRFATAISGLFTAAFRNNLNDITILKQKTEIDNYLNLNCLQLSSYGVVYSGFFFGSFTFIIAFILKSTFSYDGVIIVYVMLVLCEAINIFVYPVYIFLAGVGKALWLAFVQSLNVLFTTLFLYIGLVWFDNIFGFLGLFVSVVVLNSLTYYFVWKNYKFSLMEYLKQSNFYKLVLMIIMLLISILLPNKQILIYLFVTSVVVIYLQKKELKNICKYLLRKIG